MCRVVPVGIVIVMSLTGCSNEVANRNITEWRDFSDPQGRFSASMPALPERAEFDLPTAVGTMRFVGHSVDMPEQAKFFMVCFVDYPPEIPHGDEASAHEAMDRYVAGGARKKNLSINQKKKITLGNHPGQEYLFDDPKHGDKSLWRVYFVGDRLYQLVANWAPSEGDTSADAERFLNSFNLTN